MRWTVVAMMMLMVISMVAGQVAEPVVKQADDFGFDDNGFGEKATIWDDIKDFFGKIFAPKEYSFISTEPSLVDELVSGDYYYVGFKPKYTLTASACDNCNVGEYCEIVDEYKDRIFADYWYVSFPGDIIYLGDTQWWTWNQEFEYGYICWEKQETSDYIYSCRDGDVYLEGSRKYSCDNDERCTTSDLIFAFELSGPTIDSFFCEPKDICYACVDGQLYTEYQDGCEAGWSTSEPECEQQVPCYQCDGEDVLKTTFTGECGRGWSEDRPTCVEPVICYMCEQGQVISEEFVSGTCGAGWSQQAPSVCPVTCFTCEGGALKSQQYSTGCPAGWALTAPEICEADMVTCYQCGDGIVLSDLQESSCSMGWTENRLTQDDCSGEKFNLTQWFEDNSPESYVLLGAIFIILAAGAIILINRRGGNSQ